MKDVVGYEGIFMVTEDGQIFSKRTNKFLVQGTSKTGYKVLSTKVEGVAKCLKVHRLVAEAYVPNTENKPFVNHIDGDKTNNNINNLEWVTNRENIIHAYELGLINVTSGCDRSTSAISEEDLAYVRAVYKPFDKQFGVRKLAKELGVSHPTLSRAIRKISYKNH